MGAEPGPRIAELLDYMDMTRGTLRDTVSRVTPSSATIRPRDGAWTVADVLAHLARVEQGVARLAEKSVAWARTHGIGPATSTESVLGSLDSHAVIEKAEPAVAPDFVTPEPDVPMALSLESLAQSRERLRRALIDGSDLDLGKVTRPHHVLGELNLYQWALFVAQHEERHRRQIERTIAEVGERAAERAPGV